MLTCTECGTELGPVDVEVNLDVFGVFKSWCFVCVEAATEEGIVVARRRPFEVLMSDAYWAVK